jgi:dipeptidyl aminopeptidase/acylaminoacyl peptidase
LIFPSPFEDCADFIKYINENAGEYNIDTENIGVLGYSAGAHLAMLCAYAADLNLSYCVSLAGPTKLYGDDPADYPRSTLYVVENLFGGAYEEHEDLYKSGSPYFYLERADYIKTPLLLVHDKNDDVVPFSQSAMMFEKAVSLGIESELLELRGVAHNIEFITDRMTQPEQDEALRIILNFIYKFYKN